jgi:hypothetical protein
VGEKNEDSFPDILFWWMLACNLRLSKTTVVVPCLLDNSSILKRKNFTIQKLDKYQNTY